MSPRPRRPPALTPEDLLRDYPPEIQAITARLRVIIKQAVPAAIEKAYPGWRGIGYTHPQAGYFGCIFPLATQVKLALEHGARLPDPARLLRLPPTSAKQVRYLVFEAESDIRAAELTALLEAAIQLRAAS